MFASEHNGAPTFDLWENVLVVEAHEARTAFTSALSISKNLLDDQTTYSALGYSKKPIMYAVRSVHTEINKRPSRKKDEGMILSKIASLDEQQLAILKSHREIDLRYGFTYIDDAN